MKYADFEDIMSAERMGRYLDACNGDTNKAMMGIDSHALLYGLDHVQAVCNKINKIK